MRAAGYTGKLMYIGNFIPDATGFFSDLTRANLGNPASFEALFDHVGLMVANLYLGGAPRSRDAVRATLTSLAAMRSKPLVLMVDTDATSDATVHDSPEYHCESVAASKIDLAQQADVYQAAFEAVNAGAHIGGVISNRYAYEPELCGWTTQGFEPSASVYGKPAEAVLRWWFERL